MSWSTSDGVEFNVTVTVDSDKAVQNLNEVKESLNESSNVLAKQKGDWGELSRALRESGEEYQVESSAIRSVSWDLLLTGRSLSVMNSSLLGNNNSLKQMIGLMYSAAAAIRLVVMLYDTKRIAAEAATKKGYESTHEMPHKDPFTFGAEYTRNKEKVDLGAGRPSGTSSLPTMSFKSPSVGVNYKEETDAEIVNRHVSDYVSSAHKSGVIESFVGASKAGKELGGYESGIFSQIGEYAGFASLIPVGGPVLSALMSALSYGEEKLTPYKEGGVIGRETPALLHPGEAVVREKDYHAINTILKNSNQNRITPPNIQSTVSTPKNSTTNNLGDDVNNFVNIHMTTGAINSNVDIQGLLKKLAQSVTIENRRRTGR